MPSTPVASVSPETDTRASTTWRLQPPSASLVLWRKPRNPPSVAACALDSGVDATAAARSELRSRLPFTAVHRTVHRPQHLHGSSPSTLDARVPAIQRPSARSHRTVDNSLITGRIEYSHSSVRVIDLWVPPTLVLPQGRLESGAAPSSRPPSHQALLPLTTTEAPM